jgi:hypothetical protein
LLDIIILNLSAVLSGAKSWKVAHFFGVAQLEWLRDYREFANGIPTSHSIGRIIRCIKAKSLLECFEQFRSARSGCKEKESGLPEVLKLSGAQERVRPSTP